jgi:hypothetical protein
VTVPQNTLDGHRFSTFRFTDFTSNSSAEMKPPQTESWRPELRERPADLTGPVRRGFSQRNNKEGLKEPICRPLPHFWVCLYAVAD